MSTILIGVDSSARSEDAVALGGRLAAAGCAGVIVATIVPFDGVSRVDAHGTVRRLSGLLESPPAERVRTGVLLARSPAQGLRGLAETEAAELVVVGSTHTGHLGRVRPGSTGEHLLMGAPCAVAVAPCGYRTRRARPIERIGVAWEGSGEARAALAAAISAAGALRRR
jgi:nucleotide-binding universal stress UspA family protein